MAKRTRAFKGQKIYNTDTEMDVPDEEWERIFGKKSEDYYFNKKEESGDANEENRP